MSQTFEPSQGHRRNKKSDDISALNPVDNVAKAKAMRIRWRCRRGIRELDIILMQFLDSEYDGLTAEQQDAMEVLLSQPDPQLIDWLIRKEAPSDDSIYKLVERIRATADNRA
jgi:antitoxin CptB